MQAATREQQRKKKRRGLRISKTGAMKLSVILFLAAFLIYLGAATVRHIREYNESLVRVKVFLPGTIKRNRFFKLDSAAEQGKNGTELQASAVLDASEYYGVLKWKENDKGKIRTANGREIEKKSVSMTPVEGGTQITMTFEDSEVMPGDPLELHIDIELKQVALNTVPFDLLRQEKNRFYFYEVAKQNGIWGQDYVVKKVNPQMKYVRYGHGFFRAYVVKAPIIVESEAELKEGMRVIFSYEEEEDR